MRAISPLWVGKLTVISKTSQCGEVFSSPSLCYSWKQELIYEVSQTRFTTSLLGEAWLPKGYGGGLPLEWGSKVNVEVQSYLRPHIDAQVQVMMTQVVDKVLCSSQRWRRIVKVGISFAYCIIKLKCSGSTLETN